MNSENMQVPNLIYKTMFLFRYTNLEQRYVGLPNQELSKPPALVNSYNMLMHNFIIH